jgi:hypothetical protein
MNLQPAVDLQCRISFAVERQDPFPQFFWDPTAQGNN